MKTKKLINFTKLINGKYDLQTELEVFKWMLETGEKYEFRRHNWSQAGIDQLLFRYSANNHHSFTDLSGECRNKLLLGFIEALVLQHDKEIEEWRKGENIYLGKSRYIYFNDNSAAVKPGEYFNLHSTIYCLDGFLNKEIKRKATRHKEPESDKMGTPYIRGIKFSVSGNGDGYVVFVTYTFKFCPHSGWDLEFNQKNKSVSQFLYDTNKHLESILIKKVSE